MKKLYRSKNNYKLMGVCGGLANYLNLDPTVIRVIWAVACLFGGFGLWAYIACSLIIPQEPDFIEAETTFTPEEE